MHSVIIILVVVALFVAVCGTFPNEEFAVNVARCQNTCEFYGRNFDCPNYYKPLGDCYCKSGFARLEADGKCVSVEKNAVCIGRLPITRASCNKPNEKFRSHVRMGNWGDCDVSCLTYGCRNTYDTYDVTQPEMPQFKWAPHCYCADDHRRLSNGNCVHITDPQCVAEYQPSAARCDAIGQIYELNASCQPSCYGETYCPAAGPTCICPPDRMASIYELSYSTKENIWNEEYQYGYNTYTQHSVIKMLLCTYKEECPQTTPGPR